VPYRVALQAALCELVHDGKVVYHGHLGHELLSDVPHVLKVLLTAPIDTRVKQVRTRQKLTDAAARHYIDEIDTARSRRLMAMFGADWRDPNRYDLILNMGKMSCEGAKRVILEAAQLEDYQPTAQSEQTFNDLALGSRVQAMLFASPKLGGSALEVRADADHVHVRGRVARDNIGGRSREGSEKYAGCYRGDNRPFCRSARSVFRNLSAAALCRWQQRYLTFLQ
jgi:hypothetical protein